MSKAKVLEFSKARENKQEQIKRQYERVLFKRILGCYTVIEKLGLKPVELQDISEGGCSFRMAAEDGSFNQDEEIDFRMYFSNDTYLPTRIKIVRVQKVMEGNRHYFQYGCTFDSEFSSTQAVKSLVKFIADYASLAKEDKGDHPVWFL